MKKDSSNLKTTPWTQKDVQRLKRLYPKNHNTKLADIFGRTIQSIRKKAQKLGIQKDDDYLTPQQNEIAWTETEIRKLREMYINSSNSEIAASLKRSKQAIQTKIKKLGLIRELKERGLARKTKKGNNKWSDKELDILKRLYDKESKEYIAEKLERTPKAVAVKAGRLGLIEDAPNQNLWTIEEDIFLEKHIAKWPIEKIAKKLERTPSAVQRRAWYKHFTRNCPNQHHTQQRLWTRQEIKQLEYLLRQHSKREIAAKLGRSFQSVVAKAKTLGLKKPQIWTTKNIAILKKYYPFETNVEIARRVGTYPNTVRLKAKELRLKKSIYAKFKA